MNNVRSRFIAEIAEIGIPRENIPAVLVTAVKLPTGAIETITNTQMLPEKICYLRDAYDDEFKLKANPNVQIVGFMLV